MNLLLKHLLLWKHSGFSVDNSIRLAPQGWREKYLENPADSNQLSTEIPECPVEQKVQKSTWVRLIKKVRIIDFFVA